MMTYKMNSRGDLPGPGDCEDDYSREQVLADQVEAMTEEVLEEWINDAEQYADYDAGFSTETWLAIQKAFAERDDIEAGRLYREALREQMLPDARKAAETRIDADIANAKREAEEARADW